MHVGVVSCHPMYPPVYSQLHKHRLKCSYKELGRESRNSKGFIISHYLFSAEPDLVAEGFHKTFHFASYVDSP